MQIVPVGENRTRLVRVLKEVRALQHLHHPHIINYQHSWLEPFQAGDFGMGLFFSSEFLPASGMIQVVQDMFV